jgi:hypothetical protein
VLCQRSGEAALDQPPRVEKSLQGALRISVMRPFGSTHQLRTFFGLRARSAREARDASARRCSRPLVSRRILPLRLQ